LAPRARGVFPADESGYFSELLIEVNLVLILVPSPFTTAMIANEMPAAIKPYSIAVAPDSSARNFLNMALIAMKSFQSTLV
jgi:hypothetical protein